MEVSGTAVSIDSRSAILALPDGARDCPQPGQQVRLELELPVQAAEVAGRCLAVRARVEEVVDMRDGTRQMTVRFRKVAFKEPERAPRKPPKSIAKGWEM